MDDSEAALCLICGEFLFCDESSINGVFATTNSCRHQFHSDCLLGFASLTLANKRPLTCPMETCLAHYDEIRTYNKSDKRIISTKKYAVEKKKENEAAAAATAVVQIEQSNTSIQIPDCPICTCPLKGVTAQPESCEHQFCLPCLKKWAERTHTCPMDRGPFDIIFIFDKPTLSNNVKGSLIKRVKAPPVRQPIEEEGNVDNARCQVCRQGTNERVLLLCDNCDSAYHTYCLPVPLNRVPPGDWFCPRCAATHGVGGGSNRNRYEARERRQQPQRRPVVVEEEERPQQLHRLILRNHSEPQRLFDGLPDSDTETEETMVSSNDSESISDDDEEENDNESTEEETDLSAFLSLPRSASSSTVTRRPGTSVLRRTSSNTSGRRKTRKRRKTTKRKKGKKKRKSTKRKTTRQPTTSSSRERSSAARGRGNRILSSIGSLDILGIGNGAGMLDEPDAGVANTTSTTSPLFQSKAKSRRVLLDDSDLESTTSPSKSNVYASTVPLLPPSNFLSSIMEKQSLLLSSNLSVDHSGRLHRLTDEEICGLPRAPQGNSHLPSSSSGSSIHRVVVHKPLSNTLQHDRTTNAPKRRCYDDTLDESKADTSLSILDTAFVAQSSPNGRANFSMESISSQYSPNKTLPSAITKDNGRALKPGPSNSMNPLRLPSSNELVSRLHANNTSTSANSSSLDHTVNGDLFDDSVPRRKISQIIREELGSFFNKKQIKMCQAHVLRKIGTQSDFSKESIKQSLDEFVRTLSDKN